MFSFISSFVESVSSLQKLSDKPAFIDILMSDDMYGILLC